MKTRFLLGFGLVMGCVVQPVSGQGAVGISDNFFVDTRFYQVERYWNEGGFVEVEPEQSSYAWGAVVRLSAVSGSDYRFARWLSPSDWGTQAVVELNLSGPDVLYVVEAQFEYVTASEFLQIWPEAVPVGSGWFYSNWFDFMWSGDVFPWIFHEHHGWVFVHALHAQSIWLYDPHESMGWWFTRREMYPWLYRDVDESILYFYAGGSHWKRRWFYNYTEYPELTGWELIEDGE